MIPMYVRPGSSEATRAKKVSPAVSAGGGNCLTSRRNRPHTCSLARRIVAVEPITFGSGPSSLSSQYVHGGLENPDHRAERTGDQVKFVLDDEIGRWQCVPMRTRPNSERVSLDQASRANLSTVPMSRDGGRV